MSTLTPPPAAETPLPPTSSSAYYGVMGAALVLGGVLFGLGILPKLQKHRATVEQTRELSILRVHAVSPAPAPPAKPLSLSGELKPSAEAAIVARVTGYVRQWYVDLGDKVQAGALLAELDTPELEKELIRARAQLAVARAAQHLSEITAKRWRELLQSKSAAQQEADEKDGDLQLRTAAVDAAQAEVQRLEEVARFARITAPFAGTITARKIDVGQLLESGTAHELFRLAETDRLRVFVRAPQSYARSIQPGQTATVTLPELHGQTFQAKVVRTAGAIEASSRTLLCELEIDNTSGQLLAGSYAQVQIAGAQQEHPLTVPANALIFRSEGPQIATIDAHNRVALKPVTLGKDFGTVVEILTGISPQERVIPNPPDSLTNGVPVEVSP